MKKNVILWSLIFGTSCLNAMDADFPKLTDRCFEKIPQQILTYDVEHLLSLARKEKTLPVDFENAISKDLISNNCLLFYPGIDADFGMRCIQKFDFNSVVNFAVFSPDGKFILISLSDNTVRLCNLSGECLRVFVHDEPVFSAMFSPDGRYILTRANESKTLKLWNLEGVCIQTFNGDDKIALPTIFTLNGSQKIWPDGIRVLHVENQAGQLFRLTALLEFSKPFPHVPYIPSQDNKYILIVSLDYVVSLWSLSGECVWAFIDTEMAKLAVFSPDGQFVLTCTDEIPTAGAGYAQDYYPADCNFYVKLWNNSGQVIRAFKHINPVTLATFFPDGQYVLSYVNSGNIKLWSKNAQGFKIFRHEWYIDTAVFSPDCKKVLIAGGRRADLWNVHPLWDSDEYRNGQLSLSELAAILLILKFKDLIKQDQGHKSLVLGILNEIKEKEPIIKNFYTEFLKN